MAWSIKWHPRRFARRAAISPPPLPYSREIVMAHIRLMASISSFMTCPSCLDITLAEWCCRNTLMFSFFQTTKAAYYKDKKTYYFSDQLSEARTQSVAGRNKITLRSAERMESTGHFLK